MASTAVRDPLVLTAQPDPVTGQAVYGRPPESERPARSRRTWEDIAQALRGAEDGRRAGVDVQLLPGGELVLTGREQPAQPLSQLPKGRMAWLPPS